MLDLVIIIPVLRRPQNVGPLVQSISGTTHVSYATVFVASPGDQIEINELEQQNQFYLLMDQSYENNGDYAKKINHAFNETEAIWYFLGADDLRFHYNWFEEAMKTHSRTEACVIGTNDLGNPIVKKGEHATHSLVLAEYVAECGTIDEPGKILHEAYPHEFVDNEFVETAKCRGAWAFSHRSMVEHLHPNWKKSANDAIYAAQPERMRLGKKVYEQRKKLWM